MRRLLLIATALLLVAAACSDDDTTASEDTAAPATTADTTAGTDTTPDDSAAPPDTAEGEPYVSEVYADEAHWLCRPDMAANPCVEGLDLTVVEENGDTTVEPFVPATDPPVDCFYVYPTINLGDEGNAPFDGEYGAELGVTKTQAARFSSICDLYAPVYRQITLASFAGAESEGYYDIAYGDVEDAFRHFLANDSQGRPFVLLGHSQGSGMIATLMDELIDDDPALRERLVSALVIGSAVGAPEGADVGGDFDNIPACRSATDTGCVVTYASFRDTVPPAEDAFFGRPRSGEGVALCVNPGAPGGGPADLTVITPNVGEVWSDTAADIVPITTPYAAMPGLVTGECVQENGFSYLRISVNADPDGPRADDISGDLTPQWGLHAIDYNLALGDLLDLVDQQMAAWVAAN